MSCNNCNKKKNREYVENMAKKYSKMTGEKVIVTKHTIGDEDIYDFHPDPEEIVTVLVDENFLISKNKV
jgi:hypothetical protein